MEDIFIHKDQQIFRYKVRAHIFDDRQRLLIVNIASHIGPRWEVPGGGIHKGESISDALAREVYEEVGLDSFQTLGHISQKYFEIFTTEVIDELQLPYTGQIVEDFVLEVIDPKVRPQSSEVCQWLWVEQSEVETHLNYGNQFEVYQYCVAFLK